MARAKTVEGSVGAVLAGRYRLEHPLDQGGMATVWRAFDTQRELPVALKLLRGTRPDLLAQRLQREAQAAGRVEHPAIVRVLDASVAESGAPFLVMELLSGETLADLLGRGPISGVWAVQLLLPVMDGLDAAHAQGVVHRDLKPSNVFLDTRGQHLQPRLLDFGIAKLARSGPRLTEDGVALGSPSYMSPEQARGEDVDFRSDIWSMCVLLYRAISGHSPFKGANAHALLHAIVNDEPEPLPLGPGVDEYLVRIIMAGMSKDPLERPESMRALGEQLARWLLLHGISVDACDEPLVPKWIGSEPAGPNAEVTGAITRRIANFSPMRRLLRVRRRFMLWAVAGVLVAGASLAVSQTGDSQASAPPQTPEPTDVASARPPVVPAGAPRQPALPQVDAMLQPDATLQAATTTAEVSRENHAERSVATGPPDPSTSSPRRSTPAPTSRRPALPF